MKEADRILTVEEILRILLRSVQADGSNRVPELEVPTVRSMRATESEGESRHSMSKLYEFGGAGDRSAPGGCLSAGTWAEVAAGLIEQDTAYTYLEHAAFCRDCAQELLHALDAIADSSDAPEEIRQKLATATKEWQSNFAKRIAREKDK